MAALQGKQLADLAITTAKIANGAVTSAKVDSTIVVAGGTNPFTANVSMGGFRITSLADPSSDQDAATKAYVDAVAIGLHIRAAVRLATTTALSANVRTVNDLDANVNGALAAIDGVSLSVNDRVLVKDEATAANNGIYFVASLGSAGTKWKLTRTTDADTSAEVPSGIFTFIEEGTLNADSGWVLSTNNPITLNTTALTFVQFSGAGQITAGAGLTKTGNVLDVVIGGTSGGLTANTDSLDINYAAGGDLVAADAAAAAAGTSQLIPRADHKHAISTGTPTDVGTTNASGSATPLARSDHVHRSPKGVTSNKNLTASVTTSDNDAATASTVASANALGGYVGVRVNGINYLVGDGTKVSVDCYFSGDGGTTARTMAAITVGDTLRWNGSVAGFQLASADRIDFIYEAL